MERIIIHIDMNSYFASVEQQANPFLRGKPIAITGKRYDGEAQPRSVVTTASIEAKKVGVKTAMSTYEAKFICPSLILYPGDPEKYSDVTQRFNAIYREFTENVEQFSVDECFLDVTDEAEDYFGAAFLAQAIRERLKEELGAHITASIGIGPNKLMAKLASESVKPNGLTVLRPENLIEFIDGRALQDLCGIGPRIERRLNELGIFTFKQLRESPLELLKEELKGYGEWLHEAAHGRESSNILTSIQNGVAASKTATTRAGDPKSVGHSYTLPKDTHDLLEAKRYLLRLADKVAWRLRRDGLLARRIRTYVRYGDFSGIGQQRIFQEPTADGLELFQNAWKILVDNYNPEHPIRLVGISASELSRGPEQPSLFPKPQKVRRTTKALDKIQYRYGSSAWTRATLVNTKIKARSSGFHFDHEV